jgi:hypothetical protein
MDSMPRFCLHDEDCFRPREVFNIECSALALFEHHLRILAKISKMTKELSPVIDLYQYIQANESAQHAQPKFRLFPF